MKKILVITGPTASGKSALALTLAQKIPSEIISMDSVQVYKGLDIGSAKPTAAERAQVPHHLIDICTPNEQYDLGRFVRESERLIEEICLRNKLPIVVGGTTMYLTALLHGLSARPRGDKALRATLEALDDETLYQKLGEHSAELQAKLHRADRLRVVRALECLLLGGTVPTEDPPAPPRYDVRIIVPDLDRQELYRRINERVTQMLNRGLIEEVRGIAKTFGHHAPALDAIGYSQLITGEGDESKVPDAIRQATRRYAKRQLTYLRNEPKKKGWRIREVTQAGRESEQALLWDLDRLQNEIFAWLTAPTQAQVELWRLSNAHLVNSSQNL